MEHDRYANSLVIGEVHTRSSAAGLRALQHRGHRHENSPGIIRAANGGSILLDEIGELDLTVQPKLLRFLECGEIQPIGESRPVKVDVRVIGATNVDIDQLVSEGRFREDLYYRLNVIHLTVPPLRERREEIAPLVHYFLRKYCHEFQRPRLRLTDSALRCMLQFEWPGNVRQLSNEIRRIVALSDPGGIVTPDKLDPAISAADHIAAPENKPRVREDPYMTVVADQPLASAIRELERTMIVRALKAADGRMTAAARLLGVSRKGLFLKRRRLHIDEPAN